MYIPGIWCGWEQEKLSSLSCGLLAMAQGGAPRGCLHPRPLAPGALLTESTVDFEHDRPLKMERS